MIAVQDGVIAIVPSKDLRLFWQSRLRPMTNRNLEQRVRVAIVATTLVPCIVSADAIGFNRLG